MANKKMGRPTQRKKDSLLKLRMSETDIKILDLLAGMYHMDRSTLVRNIIWYFIEMSGDEIFIGNCPIPIDEITYNSVDALYTFLGSDEDYLEFKNEMDKRHL